MDVATEKRKTILLIDDEEVVRFTLQRILERQGYNTIDASNGKTGIELVRQKRPDIVLVDLMMPVMDGFQVITALHEEFPETPVIAVSGVDIITEVMKAIRLGAWDYLLKPINQFDLLNYSLQKSLERARLLRENRLYREHLEEQVRARTQQLQERTIELEEMNIRLEEEIETRIRAEAEIIKLNKGLEQRVIERTQELEAVNRELKETLAKLRDDEKAGRLIQHQLLPPAIQLLGEYEFSRYLKPSTFLSGDFLDFFTISERYIGFYIADVSGHGVSSAFVTVLLKSFMNQHLKRYAADIERTILDPAGLLKELNLEIIAQRIDKYLTIFYGVIDRQTDKMVCANGGQFPYPVLYDGVSSRFINENGFPIGVFDFAEYDNVIVDLPAEFALYLISDGFLEILDMSEPLERDKFLLGLLNRFDISLLKLSNQFELGEKEIPDDITFMKLHKRIR